MSIARKVTEGASGGSGGYVDDVFSTYLYEGNGTARDIVNGIDLADKGGMVWIKNRGAVDQWFCWDTERGLYYLTQNAADAEVQNINFHVTSYNSDGFSLHNGGSGDNKPGNDYASWTFAKQEGFFDVVTYTGDAVRNRQITHNLGSVPGMIIVKSTTKVDDWYVWHRSLVNGGTDRNLYLNKNLAAGQSASPYENFPTLPTDSVFYIGQNSVNLSGEEYVAYVFADDAPMFGPNEDESIIKCGTFPGADSTVDLGWEPQLVLMKPSSASGPWTMLDSMRGWTGYGVGGNQPLRPNENAAEINNDASLGGLTSTGFYVENVGAADYIYMAIRRPNKPAEEFEPEELFATVSGTGLSPTPSFDHGFPVDGAWYQGSTVASGSIFTARLIDGEYLRGDTSAAAVSFADHGYDYNNGYGDSNDLNSGYSSQGFRRAPGFFDVVTYEGDSSATTRDIPHNLTVVPEMLWVKGASSTGNWAALFPGLFDQYGNERSRGDLNEVFAFNSFGTFFGTPTDTNFGVGPSLNWNTAGVDYIAYLWASVPGVCDIGTYVGNTSKVNVDCGFTNGARFVLIKRATSSSDWMYFDTLRGISASYSPRLNLNNTDSQSTTGALIRPFSGGFQANESPANINGALYVYMAIA